MENRYAEQLIAVIVQLRSQQETSLDELNNHVAAIAGQLEKIANDIAINVHERKSGLSWVDKGDK